MLDYDIKNSTIKLVFVCNKKILFEFKNAIHSIVCSSLINDYFVIYLLTKDIYEKDIKKLNRKFEKKIKLIIKRVSQENFLDFPKHQNTYETYFKFCIPKLIPEEERLLYLDSDILVKGSLSDLGKTELKGYACAAVKDYANYDGDRYRVNTDSYYNAGVMLVNNVKGKQNNYYCRFFTTTNMLIENNSLKGADQDVINAVFHNKILDLDFKYNLQEASYGTQIWLRKHLHEVNPVVVHYNIPDKPGTPSRNSNIYYRDYLRIMFFNKQIIRILVLVLRIKIKRHQG